MPRRFAPRWLDIDDILGPLSWVTGDNSVSSYRLHAAETQQLSYVPMTVADASLCGVAMGQTSANDGPTCNAPLRYR